MSALLLLIGAGSYKPLFAQEINLFFDRLTIREGLSQSMINCIIQDQKGFMWFGTQAGFNRYDGYNFKLFNDEDNAAFLNSKLIVDADRSENGILWVATASGNIISHNTLNGETRILESGKDIPASPVNDILAAGSDLWVASNGTGVYNINREGRLIQHFVFVPEDDGSISSNNVGALYEDDEGHIWVGTLDEGLCRINPKTSNVTRYDFLTCASGSPLTHISSIFKDTREKLWIGTARRGITLYDLKDGSTDHYYFIPNNEHALPSNAVNTIIGDSKGRIWIGTTRGLALHSPTLHGFYNFYYQPKRDNSLSDDNITSIYEDRSGILWIGTKNNGINKLTRSFTVFHNLRHEPDDKNSLASNLVWSFYEDQQNNLWIGSSGGLNKFNPLDHTYEHFSIAAQSMVEHNTIRAIMPYQNNILYLGTDGGGVAIFDPKLGVVQRLRHNNKNKNSLAHNKVRDFYQNSDGTVYIATMNGLSLYDPKSGAFKTYRHQAGDSSSICDNRILDILRDRRGKIWLGTYNGLSRFDPDTETFKNYYHDSADSNSLSMNLVVDIHESASDPHGVLWVGTAAGLNRFDSYANSFRRYTTENGLINDLIYGIVEDNRGYLWFSTNQGLCRMNKNEETFKSFGHKDGIENSEYDAGAALRLRNGDLVFGGLEGVTAFSPDDIPENQKIPPVVITSFRKYDQEIPIDSVINGGKTLNLLADDKYISFEFAALDFTNPSKNRYRYKLEGFDKKWNEAGHRRFASYTNLDPGHYTFRVRGSNNDNIWNEEGASLNIYIKPPFWKTTWFRLFAVITGLFAVISFYRSRVDRIKRHREELRRKINDRTKELYKRNLDLKKAKKETDQILAHVEEGFFLLDTNMKIQSQHSLALCSILERKKISGEDFIDLLRAHIEDKNAFLARDYISFLLDERLDEQLIRSLNPLEKLAFHFKSNGEELHKNKFLNFTFRRVREDGNISGLIVTLTDVTNELKLKHKLAQTEERVKKHMDWAVSVLQTPPQLLKEFLNSTFGELESIAAISSNAVVLVRGTEEINKIGRSLHLIKGNANLLELNFISTLVHGAEEIVGKLRKSDKPNLALADELASAIAGLRGDLFELKRLIDRLSEFGSQKKSEPEENGTVSAVRVLADRMAKDLDKDVVVDVTEFEEKTVPVHYVGILKNVLVQLVRNSICHGLENAQERAEKNKPEHGTISLKSTIEDGTFILDYRDDGRGLQLEKLRSKALQSKNITAAEVKDWSKEKLADLIFMPGLSSTETVTEYAGRGVGMDLIRDILSKNEGDISVTFEEEKFCAFRITLPLFNTN